MASGETLAVFSSQHGQPPATNFATIDVRNNHLCLDFDASVAESVDFPGVLPRHYSGGGVTARLCWMATTATTGNVVWSVAIERHDSATTDLDADSFAAAQSASGGVPATAGSVAYTDVPIAAGASMDGLLVGESFRLRVTRAAADGSDTMAGDAELLRVELYET